MDACDISIWFVYSIERKSLAARGTIAQEHGRLFEITIVKPDEDIFRWEARLGVADGLVLSSFEMYVR